MDGRNLIAQADAAGDVSCCDDCDVSRARTFKAGLPTKRVRIQIAPKDTDDQPGWVKYQIEKCGPLEYNIYDPNIIMWAVQHLTYEFDPRSAIWADGLAATPPPAAPSIYKFGCCLLEAKYSQPISGEALYISRRIFVQTRERKWWLKWAYSRYKDIRTIGNIFGGRRRKGQGKRKPPMTFARFAGKKWNEAKAKAVLQLAGYSAFCLSPDTPFNRFVVITGEKRFVQTYFLHITPPPGVVAHARLGGANWRT